MRGWIKNAVDGYLDIKSFKTQRQIIVIESDDWGSLRTKNKSIRKQLNAINPGIKNDKYCQLDSIATENDLELLFDVLLSVKDKNHNPACITPNVCTANPDFQKIKENAFEQFHYKSFTHALKEYTSNQDLFSLWKKGVDDKVFVPQLHGREHLHALAWLAELREGQKDLLKAFELESWGIPYNAILKQKRNNLQAALDVYGLENETDYHQTWVEDAAQIFENSFGYSATSFIAPAFTWHSNIHKTLANAHIKTLQGIKLQYQPKLKNFKGYSKKPHYTGEIDKSSQLVYTTRNAFFEPFLNPNKDWVDSCMGEIQQAFNKNKPVIIGSHRINFVGRLDESHRDKNLRQFNTLLQQIQKTYPEAEFIDSGTLAQILESKNQQKSKPPSKPPNPRRGNRASSDQEEVKRMIHPPSGDNRGLTPPSGVGGLVGGPYPTFLIVGAQKCGTTSLHDILNEHPQIAMSQVKEINFFSIQSKFEKGLSYYSKFFKKDQNTIAIGESSPGYLCYPEVHEKIYQTLGQIKIVIILRDPVKRAFSQYWHNRRQLKEPLTDKEIIDECLEHEYSPERKGYFSRGVYYNDIKRYIERFGREHIHVLMLEELMQYPKAELQRLYSFLKVDKTKGYQKLPKASNKALAWNNPFYQYFLNNPRLTKFIPTKIKHLLFFGRQKPLGYKLPNQVYIETLKTFYKPWNKKLENLLGIKLKYWL